MGEKDSGRRTHRDFSGWRRLFLLSAVVSSPLSKLTTLCFRSRFTQQPERVYIIFGVDFEGRIGCRGLAYAVNGCSLCRRQLFGAGNSFDGKHDAENTFMDFCR